MRRIMPRPWRRWTLGRVFVRFPLVSELHPTGFFLAEKDRLRSVSLGPARRAVDATHGAGASHPFYQRSIQILDEKKFDKYVEAICERFLRRRSGPADVMF